MPKYPSAPRPDGKWCRHPQSSGSKPFSWSWPLTRSMFAPGRVDLGDRHDDLHLGRSGMIHRLNRLRHDAVIGGDDEDDDVRDIRAARAHGGERSVAGRVEEGM